MDDDRTPPWMDRVMAWQLGATKNGYRFNLERSTRTACASRNAWDGACVACSLQAVIMRPASCWTWLPDDKHSKCRNADDAHRHQARISVVLDFS
jgi:hypothetical protein